MQPQDSSSSRSHEIPTRNRRSFLERASAIAAAAVAILTPLTAGIGFVLSPLRKKDQDRDPTGFLPLSIPTGAIPRDGTPILVAIQTERIDAWNHYPRQKIGTVWLRKRADGTVEAFSSICPHLGCTVDYRSAQRDFFCPCHNSTFSIEGQRLNQIPPRDMDRLEVRVEQEQLAICYQRFRAGVAEKIAL